MWIKARESLPLSLAAALLVSAIVFIFAPAPFLAQSGAPDDGRIGVVDTGGDDRLNVRGGPSVASELVIKLEPGATVTVMETSGDGLWYRIEADEDVAGWVASEYVRIQDTVSVVLPTATASSTPTSMSSPTPTASVLPIVVAAATVSVTVTAEAPALRAALPLPTADMRNFSVSESKLEAPALDVYGPHMFPETFARAQEAATATATAGELGPTTQLPTPTPTPTEAGADGDSAAAGDAEPLAGERPTPSKPTAYTVPNQMNVRSGPGTVYDVVSSVPAGSDFEIVAISPDGAWYEVKMEGQERTGWLFMQLVTTAGSLDGLPLLSDEDVPPAPTPDPQAVSSAPSVVAAAVSAPSGGGFFGYGIQAHMLGGQSGPVLNAINDLGFNWVKQQVQWYLYETAPGLRGFGELAGIVSAADSRGISVLFSVVNAPGWAREDGYDSSVGGPPADPQTYANFVGAMAGQFCGTSLKAIEIWNEQNLHYEWGNRPLNPAEYMNLLKPAYNSIKTACPEMLVISGALTPAGSNGNFAIDDFAYLEGMYQNGLASFSDGIGAHPSGYNVPPSVGWENACATIQQTGNSFNGACDTPHHSWSFRSTMEGYRNIMNVYGDSNKRIWPTEFGWAAGGAFDPRYMYANDNSLEEQAQWTVEAYQMMKNWGWVGPAFLWNLNFRVVADGTEKAQWGIVKNDYQPMPAYTALKSMPK